MLLRARTLFRPLGYVLVLVVSSPQCVRLKSALLRSNLASASALQVRLSHYIVTEFILLLGSGVAIGYIDWIEMIKFGCCGAAANLGLGHNKAPRIAC